jgi:hypothetical protein
VSKSNPKKIKGSVTGIVFTTLHFLCNLRISSIGKRVTFHFAESTDNKKHSRLLVKFVRSVVKMSPGDVFTLHFLRNLGMGLIS